jgi:hypothetical protein
MCQDNAHDVVSLKRGLWNDPRAVVPMYTQRRSAGESGIQQSAPQWGTGSKGDEMRQAPHRRHSAAKM